MTDEEILEEARKAFLEGGPNVTTAAIATKLGLSQATLFQRFRTKEELMLAALSPPQRLPLMDDIEQGPDNSPFEGQLRELLIHLLATVLDVVPRMLMLRTAGFPVEQLRERYNKLPLLMLLEILGGWFARAQQQERIRSDINANDLAQICLGAMQMRAVSLHTAQTKFGSDDTKYIENMVAVLLQGLNLEGTE